MSGFSKRGWVLVGEWRWRHVLASETLDLVVPQRPRITEAALDRRISKEQHVLRAGWRAWIALQWLGSERHELNGLDLWQAGGRGLAKVSWKGVRKWAHSCAAAAAVASGSTFTPATWNKVGLTRPANKSDRCIWNCGAPGSHKHMFWECNLRPSCIPCPNSPLVARFGWTVQGAEQGRALQQIRCWMIRVQTEIWRVHHPGRPPENQLD